MESQSRIAEVALATLVLLITSMTFTAIPRPYPSWPTVGALPANPELVLPGVLALVVLFNGLRSGVSIVMLAISVLAAVTLLLATTSWYTLYAGTGGGVFWGGFFTLSAGTVLAMAVFAQFVLLDSR